MKKHMKKVLLLSMVLMALFALTGCRKPYNEPEFVTVTPSQTAFLVPLTGDTSEQGNFESEEMLAKLKVPTKEIQIPKIWVQNGRRSYQGYYKPTATVIIVERKPETREWTADSNTGTSSSNQGIKAESKESISFQVSMNITAQIDEPNAVKFLYRYNNKSLSDIMDNEIRSMVEGLFVAETATREMDSILVSKGEIMKAINDSVKPYFAERGITITVLGLKGDVVYDDPEIQDAINAKFKADRLQEAEVVENATKEARATSEAIQTETKANADAKTKTIDANAEAEAIKKIQEVLAQSPAYIDYIEAQKWNKWDGKLPEIMSGDAGGMLLNIND